MRLEQDLEFGRGWPPESGGDTINVFELLEIESSGDQISFASGVCAGFGDRDKMSVQYSALAKVLQKYGTRFFANAPSLWEDVQRLRVSKSHEREYQETSRMADSAFKNSDWNRVIELLGRLGDNRSTLQSARLAYARKRASK